MKVFKKLSISFKIIFFSAVLAAIFLGASFGYGIYYMRSVYIKQAYSQLEHDLADEIDNVRSTQSAIEDTILSLAKMPPIQGIIRAKENGGFDELDKSSLKQWKERLESIFSSQLEVTRMYNQLRYIDENGIELVRVNYIDGKVQVVAEHELQDKSNTDYFKEIQNIERGKIYVSKAELNREGPDRQLSLPYAPVLRYATPVFDETNNSRKGMIIGNVLVDNFIDKNHKQHDDFADQYITNSSGFFVHNPDSSREWGGPMDLDTGYNLRTEFPEIDEKMLEAEKGIFKKNSNLFVYEKFHPDLTDKKREWIFIYKKNLNDVFFEVSKTVKAIVGVGVVTFTVLFFVFLFFIKRLMSPLVDLYNATTKVAEGKFDVSIPVKNLDEIGMVSESFNKMSAKLKSLYDSLDEQIKQKTSALNDRLAELESNRKELVQVLEEARSQKALALKERDKFQTILESIGDGVFVTDIDQRVILVNDTASRLAGVEKEKIIGANYKDSFSFESVNGAEYEDLIIKTISTRKTQKPAGYSMLVRSDGIKISILHSAAPLFNAGASVIGVVVVLRDATSLIQKEEELKSRTKEAERLNDITIDREMKMIELKKELEELKKKNENN